MIATSDKLERLQILLLANLLIKFLHGRLQLLLAVLGELRCGREWHCAFSGRVTVD